MKRITRINSGALFIVAVAALVLSGCHRRQQETTPEGVTSDRDVRNRDTRGDEDRNRVAASSVQIDHSGDCNVDSVYFSYDNYDLDSRAQTQLRQNAQCIRTRRPTHVAITGMADPRGTEEYNLALGDRRANTASQFVNTQGVDRAVLHPRSVGEEYANGTDEASWVSDRRADFEIQ